VRSCFVCVDGDTIVFISKTKDRAALQIFMEENMRLRTELDLLGDQKMQVQIFRCRSVPWILTIV
jgi:hypothetical protein